MKKALVIIPVFNEEKNIGKVLSMIIKSCLDVTVNTLVVNDGSSDLTREIVNKYECLTINRDKNLGHGHSVRDGFVYALKNGYDFAIKLDGDSQHDPRYIGTVIKILRRGDIDHVHSSRYMRSIDMVTEPPLERHLVNIMFTGIINNLTGLGITDAFCGFYGLTKGALEKIKLKTDRYGIPLELLLKSHYAGNRILEVPHKLIYKKNLSDCSKNDAKVGSRLEHYYKVIRNTLDDLKISEVT